MRSKRFILAIVAAVAALGSSSGGALSQQRTGKGDLTEEFHQTYALAPGGRVSLENINGDVKVRGWDRAEVKVDAVKYAHTRERLAEADIEVHATQQAVRVETHYKYESLTWTNDKNRSYNNPATVEYTLTVPRGARIEGVELVNGGLDIEGLTGDVDASTVNGKLTARALTGPVKLSTVNGPLQATFDRVGEQNPVTLSAVNGPLSLTLPSDVNAEVRASTVHGPITNDYQLPVRRGKYVGRDMAGRLGRGGARVKLENVNGPIELHRASDGRQLSPATSLLTETGEDDTDWDEVNRDIEKGVREAQRDAEREAREALRETERERRDALREAERERQGGQTERERERREAQREAEEQRREIQRETADAAREATRDAARVSREVSRDVTREVSRSMNGVGDYRRIDRESNTYQAPGVPRVRVENFDGPITVHAWDKPEVMYTAVKRADDDHEMQGIKIRTQARTSARTTRDAGRPEATQTDSEVVISSTFDPAFARTTRREISFNASVEFDVYVPRNAVLSVSSSDGRLRVEGVSGELDLRTGDGAVDVTGGQGRVRVNTGDGRVRVADFKGDVGVETDDGRIILEGDFSQLAARTGDGAISLAIPEGAGAFIETNADDVISDGMAVAEGAGSAGLRRWKVGAGGRVYTLRTGDGQVILRRR
jgi:DUF4097 and DUF4098 domain-containing protein YvlB